MKQRIKLISDGTLEGSRVLIGDVDISDSVVSATLLITPDGVTARVELLSADVEVDAGVDAEISRQEP